MKRAVIVLSVPALRPADVSQMPHLQALAARGKMCPLRPSFPAVTWPVHANMVTGVGPRQHGVVANGFYWRDRHEVEMWTAGNEVLRVEQLWDQLKRCGYTSAVWFPMLAKRCSADYVCMPAPIHNPDGSESVWCYTKPSTLYRELLDRLGHFPLQHFWGPLANIQSTAWIVDSAIAAAARFRPDMFFIYLPHLDYAAQRNGPNSPQARTALVELDEQLGRLTLGLQTAYAERPLTWLVAGEYAITPVRHVLYPNRILREAGLLAVRSTEQGEYLDVVHSAAWAMVDHQFSHIFVRDHDAGVCQQVVRLFQGHTGVAEVLAGDQRSTYDLDVDRAGDVIVISTPESWQAYYWWFDDNQAPPFAGTVDIHAKPGYDPVELFWDRQRNRVPLDATLVQGSHGAPARDADQRSVFLASDADLPLPPEMTDKAVFTAVLASFGLTA